MLDQAKRSSFAHHEWSGDMGVEPRREHDWTGARAAAAVRGRERFVQVDMHGVDAEIARTRLAYDSVEVCPIAVKVGARLVDRIRDPDNLSLEQPARVRIRQHDRGDI